MNLSRTLAFTFAAGLATTASLFAGGGACTSGQAKTCPASGSSCTGSEGVQMVEASFQKAGKDIVTTAVEAGKFNTLAAALKAAGLVETLQGKGPFTVFAPTDEAFAKLPAGTVESLLKPENKERLKAILTYHVVPGSVMAADVTKLTGATTVQGQRIDIKTKDGNVMIDGAKVITADVAASNGVIHVIDTVILPSESDLVKTAIDAGKFKTLATALEAAGLVSTLQGEGPFTVFAPTDEAFAKLPKGTLESLLKPQNADALKRVLTYHVVPGRIYSDAALKAGKATTVESTEIKITAAGGKAKVNNANLVTTDLDASNGVIHVIDEVILPPNLNIKP